MSLQETAELQHSWGLPQHAVGHAVDLAILMDVGSVEGIMMFADCLTARELWREIGWSLRRDYVERCDPLKVRSSVEVKMMSLKMCQKLVNLTRVDASFVEVEPELEKRGSPFSAFAEPRSTS